MKPEYERVKTLLSDTVQLLCKSSLSFKELYIEGLLCITVDSDTFCLHLSDRAGDAVDRDVDNTDAHSDSTAASSPAPKSQSSPSKRKREYSADTNSQEGPPPVRVKMEVPDEDEDDDLVLVEPKQEFIETNRQQQQRQMHSRVPPLHGSDSDYDNSVGQYSGNNSSRNFGQMAAQAAHHVMGGDDMSNQDPGCSGWMDNSGMDNSGMDSVPETPQLDLQTCLTRLQINPEEFQNAMQMSTYKTDPAAFMLNKLIDLSFTKEELASAKGLGLRGEGRWQQGAGLDPDKVTAIKVTAKKLTKQYGWKEINRERIKAIFYNKTTNCRKSLKRHSTGQPPSAENTEKS